MARKEDARFVRGQGNYIDDITLPGMLHGAILRSSYAHARIVLDRHLRRRGPPEGPAPSSPGPILETLKLAWIPTLSPRRRRRARHRQGPLPGPRGRLRRRRGPLLGPRRPRAHRGRVRAAPAGDRRPRARWTPGAPIIRDDIEGKADNHIFDWEAGDAAADRRGVRQGRRRRHPGHALPPGASGTDGDVRVSRRHEQGHRQAHDLAHDPGPARPPDHLRARGGPARAQDPGHHPRHRRRLRQQGRHLPRLRAAPSSARSSPASP